MDRFIVAEISKNWHRNAVDQQFVSREFEKVINANFKIGYRLHSFEVNRIVTDPDRMNETIIAVFEWEPTQAETEESNGQQLLDRRGQKGPPRDY